MTVLSVSSLSKSYGEYILFDNVTFSLLKSEKCALVGRNGAGKTTLINIINCLEEKDSGTIAISNGSKLSYKFQEVKFVGSVFDFMLDEHKDLLLIEKKMEEITNPADIDILLKKYEEGGGYKYQANIKSILKALGFCEEYWNKYIDELSGGELERLKLARVLSSNADILFLDEPTNHLDIQMIEWLENFLRTTEKTVFFTSHDIRLLENVATSVVCLFNKTAKKYNLPYLKFREAFEKELDEVLKYNESAKEQISQYEEFVRKYRAGIKSKQIKAREKMIDSLKSELREIEVSKKIGFNIEKSGRESQTVISFQSVDLGYAYPIVKNLNFEVYRGEKIAVIGKNGAGKSTIIKSTIGELSPLKGRIVVGSSLKIGYFDQGLKNLNYNNTLFDEIFYNENVNSINQVYSLMARFGFEERDGSKKIAMLSGGEKSKLSLMKLILEQPNLLILDEPTNHLDIDTVNALKDALVSYEGTLIIVSHDRYFLDGLCD
ncbi:MAG: ABC-F family ATP-binding cassette domain-containing protein, partial [Deferribacterales bacterium]|nr:ABC-F family ATP-binding cassette domain-containing protein [Deferribacterales bacterium]